MTPQQRQNTENEYKHYTLYIYIMSKRIFWAIFFAVLMLTSCSRKNYVYLQDMDLYKEYPFDDKYEAVVHKDDRLSITVSCKKPELAIPFNIYGGVKVGADGNVSADVSYGNNQKGYRVDVDGNIDFPILGKLYINGMRVSQVRDLIKQKIEDGGYIKDPLVSIEFLNFKYTVLGAVNGPGTYSLDGDRITLLEAIAKAGDLATRAKVDRVAVIRETEGVRQMYMHDLRSKDVFNSPCFYLQQNDIVYVEPKYLKKDREERGWQITTTLLTLCSVAVSLFFALKQ